jgi:hypothetical protein
MVAGWEGQEYQETENSIKKLILPAWGKAGSIAHGAHRAIDAPGIPL